MIGIDIVAIERISRLKKRYGEAFAKRFLNENEMILTKTDATLAGFYALKEAVSKALGCGIGDECSFFDIEIYKTEKNAPKIKLSEKIRANFKISQVDASISHDGGFAIAAVILK